MPPWIFAVFTHSPMKHLLPAEGSVALPAVELALQGGIRVLLVYRNKATASAMRDCGNGKPALLLELCRQAYSVPLLINDDPRALPPNTGAQGVHLGQQDCSLSDCLRRASFWETRQLIGITCHQSLDLALEAEQQWGAELCGIRAILTPPPPNPGRQRPDRQFSVAAKQALA